MDPILAHCSKCYTIPGSGGKTPFFLTTCGSVICQKCIDPQGNCKSCGRNCSRKLLSNKMSSDVAALFMDPSTKMQSIFKALGFQSKRSTHYFKYVTARQVSMERAFKDRDGKMRAFERDNKALQTKVIELNEIINNLKQQGQQVAFQMHPSPLDENLNESQGFANMVMSGIGVGQANDSAMFSEMNASDIFPRDPPPRNDFATRSTTPKRQPRTVRFENNVQNFEFPTPNFPEQISLNNFRFDRMKKASSLVGSQYRR